MFLGAFEINNRPFHWRLFGMSDTINRKNISKLLVYKSFYIWGVYFVIFNIYCVFWRQYAVDIEYDFVDSLIWWIKEWAMWLFYTPIIIYGLSYFRCRFSMIQSLLLIGIVTVIIAVITRIFIDQTSYGESLGTTIFSLLPKYTVTYLVIALTWYFKFERNMFETVLTKNDEHSVKVATAIDNVAEHLNVEHRGLLKALNFSYIYCLKASGNYVEIFCQSEKYLKRITIKQLLSILSSKNFVQVHRSHIVNLDKVLKLNNTEAGAGILILDNNQTLAVSKNYKSSLKNQVNISS